MRNTALVEASARRGQLAEAKAQLEHAARTASWAAGSFHEIDANCFERIRAYVDAAESLWEASQAKPCGEPK